MGAAVGMGQDRADLVAPPQTGEIEMHADHPQAAPFDQQVGAHRAARFQDRKRHDGALGQFDPAPHQQGVAVPAEAVGPDRQRHGAPGALVEDPARQDALAPAETAVGLLQRDHVGVDFSQHRHDPVGIAPPVDAQGLADVVAGESDLHGGFRLRELARGRQAA